MNERGFIYPIVLMVCFLVVIFVAFQIHQFVMDKKLLKEQVHHLKVDSLLHLAYADVQAILAEKGHQLNEKLSFSYEDGEVTLTFREEIDDLQQFMIVAQLYSGETRRAWMYINIEQRQIEIYEEGTTGGA
ncbi:competence type IV pilus minor pilin ComGG [Halalkalibacter sp. AB-rgal2]|uniref:competence type IV pilus minor pilin ComGG n=1 Tax=Halalkalibacter sp. AB-rgal2 TaxID=3242695 RepID=UPI00359DF86C